MGAQYISVYRCRLCGEKYRGVNIGTDSSLCTKIMYALNDKNKHIYNFGGGRWIEKTKSHWCKDGSFGMADFQGFEKVEY